MQDHRAWQNEKGPNSLPVSVSTPAAMGQCSPSHQETEFIFPHLESWLASWLVLANGTGQKWQCVGSKCRPQETVHVSTTSLRILTPHEQAQICLRNDDRHVCASATLHHRQRARPPPGMREGTWTSRPPATQAILDEVAQLKRAQPSPDDQKCPSDPQIQ